MAAYLSRRSVVFVGAAAGLWTARSAVGEAVPATARIERLPRTQRLGAYTAALADRTLSSAERQLLIRAFARHAQQLSPLYSREPFPFSLPHWTELLREGFDPHRPDVDVALALAQIYVDARDRQAALPIVSAFKSAAPEHHSALAWSEWCGSPDPLRPNGRLRSFPLHFVVLTRNPAAGAAASLEQCRRECDILNATFRSLDGTPIGRFEFKGYTPFSGIEDPAHELVQYGDPRGVFPSNKVTAAFNACQEPSLRDPKAINVYIYDSHSTGAGAADVTSHGKRNSNRPFVFLDWQRLGSRIQNAEAHEMGHAFGLEHVGVPGASARASTNIMTSAAEGFGSGGLRDLGFTPAQAALIHYHAKRTYGRLGLGR